MGPYTPTHHRHLKALACRRLGSSMEPFDTNPATELQELINITPTLAVA